VPLAQWIEIELTLDAHAVELRAVELRDVGSGVRTADNNSRLPESQRHLRTVFRQRSAQAIAAQHTALRMLRTLPRK
jgi:hypothetical protein